jgi:hypothetical protein
LDCFLLFAILRAPIKHPFLNLLQDMVLALFEEHASLSLLVEQVSVQMHFESI